MANKRALITGITSQDGIYLSQLLLNKGYDVVGLLRNNTNSNLINFKNLGLFDSINFKICDLLDKNSLSRIISVYKFDEIYNLAAQSSVGESFLQPYTTIYFNSISVLNLLETIKLNSIESRFFQAGSSEMFGGSTMPINEKSNITPLSPYATSKATAYWSVVNYRNSYNLFASNGILFTHESFFRLGHFFIKKIIVESLEIQRGIRKVLKVGNIDIKRDFGFAPEYVKAMWLTLQNNVPDDFIICSGQAILLRDIIEYVFDRLDINKNKIIIDSNLYRPVEANEIYGDNKKIKTQLNWEYNYNFFEVIDFLIEEEIKYGK